MKNLSAFLLLSTLTMQTIVSPLYACDNFWIERPGEFRYPKMLKLQDGKAVPTHIQYGFESEYTLDRIDAIMMHYAPDESLGLSRQAWNAMAKKERGDWFRANWKRVFPDFREEGKLVRTSRSPEFDFLPERVIMDDTGNLEIVLSPMDTLEDWFAKINFINEKFGAGSMQGAVSSTFDAIFHTGPKVSKEVMQKGNFGFFNFTNDLDTLEKMIAGLERYRENPSKLVMRSFDHPWLGPMTKLKRDRLEMMLTANSEGKMLDEKYMKKIGKYANSYKFIGGTAYRPDIIYKKRRIVLEARDCHSDPKCLGDRLLRNSFFLQEGTEKMVGASTFTAFDSVNDFSKLSQKNQNMLRKLFPAKVEAHNADQYVDDALLAVETFRNFSWPLRNWATHVEFFGKPGLDESIRLAQNNYVGRLNEVEARYKAGLITMDKAQAEVQGAVVMFAEESKLYETFQNKLVEMYGDQYETYYKPLAKKYMQ
ncbi:MAG: hypothetical protein ACOYL6_12630 [Bacteriovoracaceae bacterium]